MIKVEVKVESFIGVGYEPSGWGATASSIKDLVSQLERGGIDLGRDFTARVDHAGQVFVATQELGVWVTDESSRIRLGRSGSVAT